MKDENLLSPAERDLLTDWRKHFEFYLQMSLNYIQSILEITKLI